MQLKSLISMREHLPADLFVKDSTFLLSQLVELSNTLRPLAPGPPWGLGFKLQLHKETRINVHHSSSLKCATTFSSLPFYESEAVSCQWCVCNAMCKWPTRVTGFNHRRALISDSCKILGWKLKMVGKSFNGSTHLEPLWLRLLQRYNIYLWKPAPCMKNKCVFLSFRFSVCWIINWQTIFRI